LQKFETINVIIPLFNRDRVPTVLVKEWPLTCNMFNGDHIIGPVPTLFAENIEVINLSPNYLSQLVF